MNGITYYQRNRDGILNTVNEYYKNNKVLREKAKNKYRELSEEEESMEETDIVICLKKNKD